MGGGGGGGGGGGWRMGGRMDILKLSPSLSGEQKKRM